MKNITKITREHAFLGSCFLATLLYLPEGISQTKYPSVQSQNTMTATQTMEISGKVSVGKETVLKDELTLDKLKDITLPGNKDRFLTIDKFGNVKAFGEIQHGPSPSPVLPCKIFPYWKLDGNIIGGSCVNSPFIGSIDNADVVFKTANTERMRIVASGHITATGNFTTPAKVSASAFTSAGHIKFETPAGAERMRIDNASGNVGIGTTQPSEKLEVKNGNIRVDDNYDLLLRNSHHGLGWYGTQSYEGVSKKFAGESIDGPVLYGYGGGALASTNNGIGAKIALRWDAPGNVNVLADLNVGGHDLTLGKQDGRPQGTKLGNRALVHDGWQQGKDDLVINYDGDFEDGVLVGGPKLIVDGNVGIGTDNPQSKLHVRGGALTIEHEQTSGRWTSGNWRVALETPLGYAWRSTNSVYGMYLGYGQADHGWYWMLADGIGSSAQKKYPMRLDVDANGKGILTVQEDSWSDFVYDENYKRMTFDEQEKYWKEHKHLFGIASEVEILKKGVDITGTLKGLTMNVEESRLDILDLYKMIQAQNLIIQKQQEEIEKLKRK